MSKNQKYSLEIKLAACESYLSGKLTMREICATYDISYNEKYHNCIVYKWLPVYRISGIEGFIHNNGNKSYSSEFKTMVVKEYIRGEASLAELAAKFGIPSKSSLHRWVLRYNANKELRAYNPKKEISMAKARRKTTIDERKKAVQYCMEHNHDYKEAAALFHVSYHQIYSWVQKYEESGEEGLLDKRGHHKTDDEISELERLKRENQRLKKQLDEKEMLVKLLKKVRELEGM